MSKWSDYYKNRVNNAEYLDYFQSHYSQFLFVLWSYIQRMPTNRVVSLREEGCGIGTVSKIISNLFPKGIKIKCTDLDRHMLKLATVNCNQIRSPRLQFKREDLLQNRKEEKVDIIFSHGVLEHFTDHEITKILNRQRKEAKYVIHYVPTNRYKTPSFGDERLLTIGKWEEFGPFSALSSNEGKDLTLIWKGVK